MSAIIKDVEIPKEAFVFELKFISVNEEQVTMYTGFVKDHVIEIPHLNEYTILKVLEILKNNITHF